MSIVTDFLTGIVEFVTDVFVLRRERETRGSAARSVSEDAAAVAQFNFITLLWISLVSVGVMALLVFGFDVPAAWESVSEQSLAWCGRTSGIPR